MQTADTNSSDTKMLLSEVWEKIALKTELLDTRPGNLHIFEAVLKTVNFYSGSFG